MEFAKEQQGALISALFIVSDKKRFDLVSFIFSVKTPGKNGGLHCAINTGL
jgi:hypothetical protein